MGINPRTGMTPEDALQIIEDDFEVAKAQRDEHITHCHLLMPIFEKLKTEFDVIVGVGDDLFVRVSGRGLIVTYVNIGVDRNDEGDNVYRIYTPYLGESQDFSRDFEINDQAPDEITNYLKEKATLVWGKPGIGKSAVIRECAEEQGIVIKDLDLSP